MRGELELQKFIETNEALKEQEALEDHQDRMERIQRIAEETRLALCLIMNPVLNWKKQYIQHWLNLIKTIGILQQKKCD